jgi:hypothetical protein
VVSFIFLLGFGTVNKIYHTVGTVPKPNRKIKDTTPLEQFQNLTEK